MSELTAGRELDVMIARKVMDVPCNGERTPDDSIWCHRHGKGNTVGAERYSTDMNWAMQVVEKMRQSQKWCCITIHSDHHYVWRVSFTRSPTEDSDTHEPAVSITGESLPECICLAALEAVESLEVKNELR